MTRRSHLGLLASLTLCGGLVAGCASQSASSSLGATPGGAQDSDLARDKVAHGIVPQPQDITVEGVLNEHDLPLEAPPCDRTLCGRAAYGVAPAADTDRAAVFIQMGFASGIDPETFRRPPLNLAIVVDRSGSMQGEKLQAVTQALSRLIDQLTQEDRLSLVLFDDRVDVLVPSTEVTSREQLRRALSRITARGSTDMASGLRAGYEQVAAYAGTPGVNDRVLIFTDAQANTGDVDVESFTELAAATAEQGIGLTVFGVGVDLNQDLTLAITKLRGGSYFYLGDAEKIATVFDRDFDLLVTPLAYDLTLTLTPSPGFRVAQVYGEPSWQSGSRSVTIAVSTLFLSRTEGAVVARLETADPAAWPPGKPPLAELALAYTETSGEVVTASLGAAYEAEAALGDDTVFYSQRSVRKTVALVNTALAMRRACALYARGLAADATELLDRTARMLQSESAALEDPALRSEVEMVQQLASNMGVSLTHTFTGTEPPTARVPLHEEHPAFACAISATSELDGRSVILLALLLVALTLALRR
jgi:Ca-activated chloride channel family protein